MSQATEAGHELALAISKGACNHCWHPEIDGDACPVCAANAQLEAQEIHIAELEECVLWQARELSRLAPELVMPPGYDMSTQE